jgi:hypothetical protein
MRSVPNSDASPQSGPGKLRGRRLLEKMPCARVRSDYYAIYKKRNEIERLFRGLKGFRRIFSRFEKLDVLWGFSHSHSSLKPYV